MVILAGYRDRMDTFFQSNPGVGSRIAHPLDFPDDSAEELCRIAALIVAATHYRFDAAGAAAMRDSVGGAWRSRALSMPGRSAMRWIGRGCARPTGCLRPAPPGRSIVPHGKPFRRKASAPAACFINDRV